MGIVMKSSKNAELFAVLFTPDSQELQKVTMIEQAGGKVLFGLFNFQINSPDEGVVYATKLPIMSVMIGTHPEYAQVIKKAVAGVIEEAFVGMPHWALPTSVAPTPTTTTTTSTTPTTTNTGSFFIPPVPPPKKNTKAAPAFDVFESAAPVKTGQVVKLKEAKAVGQRVHGTSGGSVYLAFAVGEVNLAVKTSATSASVRAEAANIFTSAQRKALADCGFSDHGSYMSVHLNCGSVPIIRVLGAIAFSLDLTFDQLATSMGALNA